MEPTLEISDRYIIDKFTYHWQSPKVGDIVAVNVPEDVNIPEILNFPPPYYLVKRIVAVEGESVQMYNTKLIVNDEPRTFNLRYPLVLDFNDVIEEIKFAHIQKYMMKFGINKPYIIPKNSFFLLGDNRVDSTDSRYFGALPREEIQGKVIKIIWPPSRAGSLYPSK